MSFVGRHEFGLGSSRYLLCRASEAGTGGGRMLAGDAATRLIATLLHSADGWLVRSVYADLSGSFGLYRVSDDQILRWFSAQLGGDTLGNGGAGLALVELESWGMARPLDTKPLPPSTAQRLLARLAEQEGKDLSHSGHRYRLALVSQQDQDKGRSSYEALSPREAASLLGQMAADGTRRPATSALLRDAAALMAPAARRDPRDELVLLRRQRVFLRDDVQDPVTTPSQLRKVKETEWVELRFIDETGAPMSNQAYAVKLSDGSTQQGSLDENGLAYLGGIAAGICEVTFPGFVPKVAS